MQPRNPTTPSSEFPHLTADTTQVWDQLADWWDDKIGDGNATQDLLIEPTQERLLGLKPGEQVLDIACGAGRFTRRMASQGANILAIDHSKAFIDRARRRTADHAARDRIEYRVMNAADSDALLALGERRFDAAVATMAIMDMASIEPMLSALPRLLKPTGRFVFSVTHPVFNSGDARLVAEQENKDDKLITTYSIKVSDYLTPRVHMGVGIGGQPVAQHYFHRPISVVFNACFAHGFMLDRMEEPALPEGTRSVSGLALSWANFTKVAQVLVARMRPVAPGA